MCRNISRPWRKNGGINARNCGIEKVKKIFVNTLRRWGTLLIIVYSHLKLSLLGNWVFECRVRIGCISAFELMWALIFLNGHSVFEFFWIGPNWVVCIWVLYLGVCIWAYCIWVRLYLGCWIWVLFHLGLSGCVISGFCWIWVLLHLDLFVRCYNCF